MRAMDLYLIDIFFPKRDKEEEEKRIWKKEKRWDL